MFRRAAEIKSAFDREDVSISVAPQPRMLPQRTNCTPEAGTMDILSETNVSASQETISEGHTALRPENKDSEPSKGHVTNTKSLKQTGLTSKMQASSKDGMKEKKFVKKGVKEEKKGKKGKKTTLVESPEPVQSLLRVHGPLAPFAPGAHHESLTGQRILKDGRAAEAMILRNPAGDED